ncbi:hypothetical protein chiPu_0014613 [Chiloscyllium punctatum]|uniref:Uncharacterized protein n=1 Tax=Chiloscyllium punctatum TaxID=137246 RepID=A0A401T0H1_CHIPU|nr:hypothetical protein [Chiloscyllium punctatum]
MRHRLREGGCSSAGASLMQFPVSDWAFLKEDGTGKAIRPVASRIANPPWDRGASSVFVRELRGGALSGCLSLSQVSAACKSAFSSADFLSLLSVKKTFKNNRWPWKIGTSHNSRRKWIV